MSSPTRQSRFVANQRRQVKAAIAKRRAKDLAEEQAEADQRAADARIASRDKGIFAPRLTGSQIAEKWTDAFGLKKAAARRTEALRAARTIDPEQERDSKGRLILKRNRRLAKEQAFYDRERTTHEATYRRMISPLEPPRPPELPPRINGSPSRLSSALSRLSTSPRILNRGRPMSLQMGQGGWDEEGFFGLEKLGVDLLGKAGRWAKKKLGGGQGPGPRRMLGPLEPNVRYRGKRPGLDFGDFAPGGVTQTTRPSVGGYRLNKSGYFLKSGEWIAPGTRWVKARRRNSLNPKALSRAIARISGAKKASTQIGRVTIRKKC